MAMRKAAEKISIPAKLDRLAAEASRRRPTFTIGSAWREGAYHHERKADATTWILSCIMRGRQRIVTADGATTSQGFRLRLIRPRLAYRVDSVNGASYWCIFSSLPAWEPLLDWPQVLPGIMYLDVEDLSLRRRIVRLLEETQRLARANHPQREALVRNAIERFLLLADAINPQAGRVTIDPRVQRAAAYLGRRLHRPFAMGDLARHAHLSPSRLAHLFQQQMGQSPKQFHEAGRMEEACQLLRHSGLPVKEIASELGFANPYHFSRRFRQWMGASPRTYRVGS